MGTDISETLIAAMEQHNGMLAISILSDESAQGLFYIVVVICDEKV